MQCAEYLLAEKNLIIVVLECMCSVWFIFVFLLCQMKTDPHHQEVATGDVVGVDSIPVVDMTDVEEGFVAVVEIEEGVAALTGTGTFSPLLLSSRCLLSVSFFLLAASPFCLFVILIGMVDGLNGEVDHTDLGYSRQTFTCH